MAGAGSSLVTKFPNNQIYVCVFKSDQKGHKLPLFVNFRNHQMISLPHNAKLNIFLPSLLSISLDFDKFFSFFLV